MCKSEMSQMFWENAEPIYEKQKTLITPFRYSLMMSQIAAMYANKVRSASAMLLPFVSFIAVTNIQTCQPGGMHATQHAVHSGHKRFHCLLFCTLPSPDGLTFFCDVPTESRGHDLILLTCLGLDSALLDNLYIDGTQYYVYGNSSYQHHTRP